MATKKITLNELRSIVRQIIKENLDDTTLKNNLENLPDKDFYSISMNVWYDWDDVDEEELLNGILEFIKKVNPDADLDKKKMSLMRALSETNEMLYSAMQKEFSVAYGLKKFFLNNLNILK